MVQHYLQSIFNNKLFPDYSMYIYVTRPAKIEHVSANYTELCFC